MSDFSRTSEFWRGLEFETIPMPEYPHSFSFPDAPMQSAFIALTIPRIGEH
jgi:hypothetical protein